MRAIEQTDSGGVKINAEAVKDGDFISADDLEVALEMKRGESRYAFELMRMKAHLELDLAAIGRPAMVRTQDYGLIVMHPDEAAGYTARRFGEHVRGMERLHDRMSAVAAVASLSAEVRRQYDREASIRARVIGAMKDTLKESDTMALLAAPERVG